MKQKAAKLDLNGHKLSSPTKGQTGAACMRKGCTVAIDVDAMMWQARKRSRWVELATMPIPACVGATSILDSPHAIQAVKALSALRVDSEELLHFLEAKAIDVRRLHALDDDHDDLGWYARGHYSEDTFRLAVELLFWGGSDEHGGAVRWKHPSEADEKRCRFVVEWWRLVPSRGGRWAFRSVPARARGAFPVTALLTPNAEI